MSIDRAVENWTDECFTRAFEGPDVCEHGIAMDEECLDCLPWCPACQDKQVSEDEEVCETCLSSAVDEWIGNGYQRMLDLARKHGQIEEREI
jgi:hypothetical protein